MATIWSKFNVFPLKKKQQKRENKTKTIKVETVFLRTEVLKYDHHKDGKSKSPSRQKQPQKAEDKLKHYFIT